MLIEQYIFLLSIIKIYRADANPEAKFIVPDWGDKVDSGIGLSYRPGSLAGQYDIDNPLCRNQLDPLVRDCELVTDGKGVLHCVKTH